MKKCKIMRKIMQLQLDWLKLALKWEKLKIPQPSPLTYCTQPAVQFGNR